MSDGIYSALSGAIAEQRSLDVIANNVANTSTDGYRADRVAFSEVLGPNAGASEAAPDSLRYVAVSEIRTDQTEGPIRQTGNPLDLALTSDGFFSVETPAGERYTRAGSFALDGNGTLRTHAGHKVLGQDEEQRGIVIPQGTAEVQIGEDGTVRADNREVGRLRIVRFEGPNALEREGLTLFKAQRQPVRATEATVLSGHIEGANVNAVAGLNELITTTRSFEAFQKVIQGFRQIDERTARDLGSR